MNHLNQSQTDLIESAKKVVNVSVQKDGVENVTEGLITPVAMTK